ncbi:hypothetical protein [Nocardia sp. AG03]|uniref:hypothetical protein n=1 Tax=Nocardia sp. AG03 TaxID=3025312 RepID=UPI0024188C73|nr:hypothetical protein [Nocardia sp. AG03]
MRWLLAGLIFCASCLSVAPVARADAFDGEPVETVRLNYDLGRCDTDLLVFSSEVPVRLEITVRNQFDPQARMRIPRFAWTHGLPVSVEPVTSSAKFMARAGEYEFDVVTGDDDRKLCEGLLVSL